MVTPHDIFASLNIKFLKCIFLKPYETNINTKSTPQRTWHVSLNCIYNSFPLFWTCHWYLYSLHFTGFCRNDKNHDIRLKVEAICVRLKHESRRGVLRHLPMNQRSSHEPLHRAGWGALLLQCHHDPASDTERLPGHALQTHVYSVTFHQARKGFGTVTILESRNLLMKKLSCNRW